MSGNPDKDELAAGDDWRKWGAKFGWRLYGWTGRETATFSARGHNFTISNDVALDIETAMQPAAAALSPPDEQEGLAAELNAEADDIDHNNGPIELAQLLRRAAQRITSDAEKIAAAWRTGVEAAADRVNAMRSEDAELDYRWISGRLYDMAKVPQPPKVPPSEVRPRPNRTVAPPTPQDKEKR